MKLLPLFMIVIFSSCTKRSYEYSREGTVIHVTDTVQIPGCTVTGFNYDAVSGAKYKFVLTGDSVNWNIAVHLDSIVYNPSYYGHEFHYLVFKVYPAVAGTHPAYLVGSYDLERRLNTYDTTYNLIAEIDPYTIELIDTSQP